MKKGLPVVLILLVLVTWMASGAQSSDDTFTSTASLFTIGSGARPIGMGNAFVALADDGNALLYNPAGLTTLDDLHFTSFYSNQYGSFNYGTVGVAGPSIGISYLHLSTGVMDKRNLYGEKIGEFSYTSRGLIGAYAKSFGNLSLGLQSKAYLSDDPVSAYGTSLTPGLLYRMEPFQIGAVFKNLVSTEIKYENHEEPWVKEAVMGIAYKGKRFRADLDVEANLNKRGINPNLTRVGVEGKLFPHVVVRTGMTSELQSSIGVSLKFEKYQFDYAYSTHEELNTTHRVSFTIKNPGSLFEDFIRSKGK